MQNLSTIYKVYIVNDNLIDVDTYVPHYAYNKKRLIFNYNFVPRRL